jgi:hypothetical protein
MSFVMSIVKSAGMKSIEVGRLACLVAFVIGMFSAGPASSATRQRHYYAHDTKEDEFGVIAPWYQGQNGQCDFRVRIAAETLKRYPWTDPTKAVAAVPEYVFNGSWSIAGDGTISVPPIGEWENGDLGQRAAYVLTSLVDYYRYTGDPAAIAHLTYQADVLLDYCQTGPDHSWPNFLISVPTRGKVYGKADPNGYIQLDIVGEVGLGLLRAYELTGNKRWFDAAKHWGDVLAAKRDRTLGADPWGRYANPDDIPWHDNKQTGGVVFLLYFFDELIRLGHTGSENSIVQARDAGRAYLRDDLLRSWTVNDTWGRNYWDWPDPVQAENVTEFVCRYMMDNKDYFPNWRADVRNIASLFLNHTSVDPAAGGEVYSGAWAYPESNSCCGRSLWYGPMELAVAYAQYGVEANSKWGREMARRQQILATYDIHETGVSEDGIDGGAIVCGGWFKIAHPMALKHVLGTIAWLPEELGANRENHIARSSAVVNSAVYSKGKVDYSTFDAPANTVDVLRLAFEPNSVTADGTTLKRRSDLSANGYSVKSLANGDCIVTIRHDGRKRVVVSGDDPQQVADDTSLKYEGDWTAERNRLDLNGESHVANSAGAAVSFEFTGNQVRVIGRADVFGGLGDVYLDGKKQLVGIDCWNPSARYQQVLYYNNGLEDGKHSLRLVARGAKNPHSKGDYLYVDAVQWSSATGSAGFGSGGGPTGAQRVVFGYTGNRDIEDSSRHAWRPATEVVTQSRAADDSVLSTWWTERATEPISGTPDSELYRYGMHSKNFVANFTVGPGVYYARLKFACTRKIDPKSSHLTVYINGHRVMNDQDIAALAGGTDKAADVVLNGIEPRNGVIAVRFAGSGPTGEAFVQAVEICPGRSLHASSDRYEADIPAILPPSLTGFVKGAGGAVVAGAIVQTADGSYKAETGADGSFSFPVPDGSYSLRATKSGYYPQLRNVNVGSMATCTFDIVPVDGNLLHNAGFDDGWPDGWQIEAREPGMVRAGHTAAIMGAFPVFYQSGEEATEILTASPAGGEGRIYQSVGVQPNQKYTAVAWFRGYGPSWGVNPKQKAGLFVQEFDTTGALVVDHPIVWATEFDHWSKLTVSFTTEPGTVTVKVGGCAYLVDDYNRTTYRAIFDTFELVGPPGQSQ